MSSNGCTPEGIALIEALNELIDARYDSHQKFLDAVTERGYDESVKTFSAKMGGGSRY